MSHKATNWAFEQRGLKPAQRVVLLYLADCHNPGQGGAFPSQKKLAELCEISRSALNTNLDQLESAGLIAREKRRKNGSTQHERTRYYFPFEPAFAQYCSNFPSPESGHGDPKAVSGNGEKPSPENGESRVQNLDSNPVREPVRETVKEKEARETPHHDDAAEVDAEENSKSHERRVKALEIGRHNNPWPGALGKETRWAVMQFAKLLPAERLQAEERRDEYLAACGGKPVSLGVYLRDRKFMDIAARKAPAASAQVDGFIAAPIFGPAWCAARMVALLRGPVAFDLPDGIRGVVAKAYEVLCNSSQSGARRYAVGKGLTITDDGSLVFPDDFERQERLRVRISNGFPAVNRLHDPAKSPMAVDARFAHLKDHCEAVKVGSEVFDDWRIWHEQQVLPWLPDTGSMRVVWFPAGGPGAIRNFEQHAKEVFNGRD